MEQELFNMWLADHYDELFYTKYKQHMNKDCLIKMNEIANKDQNGKILNYIQPSMDSYNDFIKCSIDFVSKNYDNWVKNTKMADQYGKDVKSLSPKWLNFQLFNKYMGEFKLTIHGETVSLLDALNEVYDLHYEAKMRTVNVVNPLDFILKNEDLKESDLFLTETAPETKKNLEKEKKKMFGKKN